MLKSLTLVGLFFTTVLCYAADRVGEPVQPIPDTITLNPKKVELGKRLFHDKRLSKDDSISCASCHSLDTAGVDNKVVSMGINQQEGHINAPTVLNSGFNFVQFWDGRAKTLEDQIEGPIHNPIEMGADWKTVIIKLNDDPDYVVIFKEIYGTRVMPEAIKDAIATFNRSLITPAPFDRYLHPTFRTII